MIHCFQDVYVLCIHRSLTTQSFLKSWPYVLLDTYEFMSLNPL